MFLYDNNNKLTNAVLVGVGRFEDSNHAQLFNYNALVALGVDGVNVRAVQFNSFKHYDEFKLKTDHDYLIEVLTNALDFGFDASINCIDYDSNFRICDTTGEVVHVSRIDGERFYYCDHCGHLIDGDISPRETLEGRHDYFNLCPDCVPLFERCNNCGYYYERDCMEYDEDADAYVCSRCYRDAHRFIFGYHGAPVNYDNEKRATTRDDLASVCYFGVELETEGVRDLASLTAGNCGGLAYTHNEEDASLTDGHEIITAPLSLDYWRHETDDFKNVLKQLIEAGGRSHDTTTCGLHIHASRECIRNLDRLCALVNLFTDNIQILARRGGGEYNVYIKDHHERVGVIKAEDMHDALLYDAKYNKHFEGHYNALNTNTSQRCTIEFRMFKGTLRYETILASIEFVNNLIDMANDESAEVVYFSDLLDGEFLPDYVRTREGLDLQAVADLRGLEDIREGDGVMLYDDDDEEA